jgi:hypothetical protein
METTYAFKDLRYVKENIYYRYLRPASKKISVKEKFNFPVKVEPAVEIFFLKHKCGVNNTLVFNANTKTYIDAIKGKVNNIINVNRINDIGYINKFFESVNQKLVNEGVFVGCVETTKQRKEKLYNKYPAAAALLFYLFDFVFKRICSKIFLTKKLYYTITRGKGRIISLAETLGRLVLSGFEILGYEEINGLTYFAAKRITFPRYEDKPTCGFIIRLRRIGENGNIINIYKFRTMSPYSECLQEYIHKRNKLKTGGKFNGDFRITDWGKILRKLRIDEMPMIINYLKGDVKLVGVRPLSLQYYSMYEEDIRNRRIKYKPGLFPPFFADLPKTFNEIMDSERKYLNNYDMKPVKTDLIYFLKIMYNINFKMVLGE